jgi:hypothetical protein
MISESLASAVLAASISGAGLVIAFYALIAHMSDKIFEIRFESLDRKNKEVEHIANDPDSFKGENLRPTTGRLTELSQEIDSIKTFPRYLGPVVAINFCSFLLTAFLSVNWLSSSLENRATINDWTIPLPFLFSVGLFGVVGVLGIIDAMSAMKDRFEKLSEKKEEVKEEIKNAPMESECVLQVEKALNKIGVGFHKEPLIKVDGTALFPDFVVPSAKKPEYLIEVLLRPNADSIYRISKKYDKFKSEKSVKTILISDFRNRLSNLDMAKAYWDFVVDVQNLDELKDIFGK